MKLQYTQIVTTDGTTIYAELSLRELTVRTIVNLSTY